jgi:tetratricopeptide (TPR) repeat protein
LDGRLEDAIDAWARHVTGQEEFGTTRGNAFGGDPATRAAIHLGLQRKPLRPPEGGQGGALAALEWAYSGHREAASERLAAHMGQFRVGSGTCDAPSFILAFLLETAVVLEDRHSTELLARELAVSAFPLAGGGGQTVVSRHLGAAAALLGNTDEARTYYQQAIEACQKIRFRPEMALTRLQLAELLLEHYPDEKAEALEHLDFAIAEFREMKMQPSLERALRHRELLKA